MAEPKDYQDDSWQDNFFPACGGDALDPHATSEYDANEVDLYQDQGQYDGEK